MELPINIANIYKENPDLKNVIEKLVVTIFILGMAEGVGQAQKIVHEGVNDAGIKTT